MKKCSIAIAVAGAVISTPAFAQDDSDAHGGFYGGAIVGIDSVELSLEGESESEEDILYGVVLGYDFAGSGNVVLGIEAEWADSGVSYAVTDIFEAGDRAALSAGRDLYLGVRAGTKISESAMIYFKGGYTNAKATLTYDDGVDVFRESDELDGFRIGAGAEFAIQSNFAVRVEYRYSDYGEYSYDGFNTGISAKRHQGLVGLLAKF